MVKVYKDLMKFWITTKWLTQIPSEEVVSQTKPELGIWILANYLNKQGEDNLGF